MKEQRDLEREKKKNKIVRLEKTYSTSCVCVTVKVCITVLYDGYLFIYFLFSPSGAAGIYLFILSGVGGLSILKPLFKTLYHMNIHRLKSKYIFIGRILRASKRKQIKFGDDF